MGSKNRARGWPPAPDPLPFGVVDNHTHLPVGVDDDPGLIEDAGDGGAVLSVGEHVERALAVGVDGMVQVGCDLDTAGPSVALAHAHPRIVAAVAIHPNEAPLHDGVREVAPDGLDPAVRPRHDVPLADALGRIAELARDERVRAVGETGLDHFRAGEKGRAVQRQAFRAHLALAKELDLPVQIHDRDAHADVVDVLLADGAPERTVFHCFSGDVGLAEVCAEHGWYASFAGPVTFSSSTALRDALRVLPDSLLLVETDAPYLTPHPYRGRPNAPYVLPRTVRRIAEERGTDLADLCRVLAANTEAVYGNW